jgi:hypothetical protein
MKALLILLGACCAGAVWAQQEEDPTQGSRRPAVEDLQPAVDVSRLGNTSAPAARPPAASRSTARAPAAGGPVVMDTLDLGTTSITGNQELPKVLYIVPWKRSDLGDLVGRPVNTLLDEVLAPVDPEVFERQLNYYETLYGDSQKE